FKKIHRCPPVSTARFSVQFLNSYCRYFRGFPRFPKHPRATTVLHAGGCGDTGSDRQQIIDWGMTRVARLKIRRPAFLFPQGHTKHSALAFRLAKADQTIAFRSAMLTSWIRFAAPIGLAVASISTEGTPLD